MLLFADFSRASIYPKIREGDLPEELARKSIAVMDIHDLRYKDNPVYPESMKGLKI